MRLNLNLPSSTFSLAATGINITGFVSELIEEQRLHRTLFASLEKNGLSVATDYMSGPSASSELVSFGCDDIHRLYSKVLTVRLRINLRVNSIMRLIMQL
jgi:hypothetical protein